MMKSSDVPTELRTQPVPRPSHRCFRMLLVLVCLTIPIRTPDGDAAEDKPPSNTDDAARLSFFESRIRPVLTEHCYGCHAQDARQVRGGLLLDSRTGLLTGGDSGPALVPGRPDESLLLQALRHETFEMPPDRRLPDRVIRDFEQWIRDGAVDPRTGGAARQTQVMDLEQGRRFWCFQPVRRPPVPDVAADWVRNDIDRLVAAVHLRQQVTPVEDATPEQIVRRLYFTLIGLPPTPDQSAAFVASWQQSPDAVLAATVDELLASVHFGERWGRHWLDVARFAESSGGGRSLMYPDAWRYRDYVIRSFNSDKAFDQFVREQIAGDLLPARNPEHRDDQLTGVGYLIMGAINYEEQDKEALRMDVVDEQIDSMGRTFLAMTLGCARCHDHKFDPVPTADYYALAGIFRSTQALTPGNVSGYVTRTLETGYDRAPVEAWESTERTLQQQIAELRQLTRLPPTATSGTLEAGSLPGVVVDDTQARFTGDWSSSSSLRPWVGRGYRHSGEPRSGISVSWETSLPESGLYSVRISYNAAGSRSGRIPVIIEHADGQARLSLNQQQDPSADGVFTDLGQFRFDSQQPAVVTVDARSADSGYVIADAVQFMPVAATATPEATADSGSTADQRALVEQLRSLEARLKAHEKKRPAIPQVMCVQDDAQPADWHVHIRGGIRNLGPKVPRGFLTVTRTVDAPAVSIPAGSSGRQQLAEWLASADNPLTARVFVNRVWMHVMGEGLVRTPDNFGVTGQLPTHPELLEYLAASFVEDDHWSVKRLIRRICLSRTFRLSSTPNALQQAQDPENLLLTHGFRRRLDAESLRDTILMISGQLDLSVTGGLTIGKLSTYDNAYSHTTYPARCRSVFVPGFRNAMLDMFFVFDMANPNLVTGKRTASTLPSQALFLMNSPFLVEQSELAARHFLTTESRDPEALEGSVQRIWQLTMGRIPTSAELQPVMEHLRAGDTSKPGVWADVFHAAFGSVDFRYLD